MSAERRLVPSAQFRSAGAVPDRRRDDYRAHMSGSWVADLTEPSATETTLTSTVWHLGAMVVTVNDFPARRVARTRKLARSDQLDHYYVHLPLAAAGLQVEANKDCVRAPQGQPVMMDLGQPFDTYQGAGRSMQAFMPREMLDDLLPRAHGLHATLMQGAASAFLSDLLLSLVRRLPDMGVDEAAGVAKGTLQMVAAAVAPTLETLESARPVVEHSLLRQARHFIETRLDEPGFGPESLCAPLRISRAALYRLFEPHGGVAAYIRERRLSRIHGAIAQQTSRRPLSLLAEDYGFKSASQFSKAFKAHFGYSPKEVEQSPSALLPGTGRVPVGERLAGWIGPLKA